MVSKVAETAPSANTSFRHHAERFLALTHGECGAMSYREINDFITSLYGAAGMTADMDVKELNEDTSRGGFSVAEGIAVLTAPTKKKRWGFFKRLIRYCWETRAIELPRNLDSRTFKFKVQPKAVKTYTREVKDCLDGLNAALRLYAMLGLNCGMTNVDIGSSARDQIKGRKAHAQTDQNDAA